jgi:hypothetical protein
MGRFRVTKDVIDHSPDDLATFRKIMANFIVIRCEFMYADQCFHYVAYSDLFEEVPEAMEVPEYAIHLVRTPDGEVNLDSVERTM